MKIKMAFFALALMALASLSQAQVTGTAVVQNGAPLPQTCAGGPIIPDGSTAWIIWDMTNNGPTPDDVPAPMGSGVDQGNYNSFALNGNDYLGVPGGFYTDPAFVFSFPTGGTRRFYVRVESPTARWTSRFFQLAPNGFSDEDVTGAWTCEITAVPCNEPLFVSVPTPAGRLTPLPIYQCIRVCAGTTVQVCVGPLSADEYPHALVLPGCFTNGCQVECPPAQFGYNPLTWIYNPGTGQWCNVIVAGSDGCVCFYLEFIEGAVDVSLTAEAGDNSVNVLWSTVSETEMARFDVQRRVVGHTDFQTVGSVEAGNDVNGGSYSYVDGSALNGTMYEYTLNLVDVNGNVSPLGTIASATPSVNAAVVTEYALHQNYPNPFNPSTSLVYDVVAENNVNLTVFNAMGQEVATLVNGTVAAGRHTVSFDAANLTSGLYFYTVKIGNEFTATKKMLLVK